MGWQDAPLADTATPQPATISAIGGGAVGAGVGELIAEALRRWK